MAVPKYRTSKSKRDMRRSHHALTPVVNSICSNCKEVKRPHSVCEACGHHKGKQVIEPKARAGAADQDFTTED